jgi:hypothetical protein
MRARRVVAVRPCLGLAGEGAAGVGVVRIARRMHSAGRGVDPDDRAAGAAQPGIVLGVERKEVPGPVRSGALRGRGGEETDEKCRGDEAEHVVPLCGSADPVYTGRIAGLSEISGVDERQASGVEPVARNAE